jgi:hypothetical protein
MPAPRGKKRKSEAQSTVSDNHENTPELPTRTVATKTGDEISESPRKRRKVNITAEQKQGLIEDLQIESKCSMCWWCVLSDALQADHDNTVAGRARKLRTQYNAQIQNLRARIEIRVNRIPLALRKIKMGELLAKRTAEDNGQKTAVPSTNVFKPPPVPQKDFPVATDHPVVGRPVLQRTASSNASMAPPPSRGQHKDDISGGNKENQMAQVDIPKKPRAAGPVAAVRGTNPSQVLSPTSSNSRMLPPREGTPGKSLIARPVSPTKPSVLSNMVEKARSTRAAATSRKTTTLSSSTTSSSAAPPAKATRTRKAATATTAAAASRVGATSRATRRVSAVSESSDGSTGTVVRKRTTTAAKPEAPPPAKRTVMGTIRKGVTGTATRKTAAPKAAPAASTGRVLRKRNP